MTASQCVGTRWRRGERHTLAFHRGLSPHGREPTLPVPVAGHATTDLVARSNPRLISELCVPIDASIPACGSPPYSVPARPSSSSGSGSLCPHRTSRARAELPSRLGQVSGATGRGDSEGSVSGVEPPVQWVGRGPALGTGGGVWGAWQGWSRVSVLEAGIPSSLGPGREPPTGAGISPAAGRREESWKGARASRALAMVGCESRVWGGEAAGLGGSVAGRQSGEVGSAARGPEVGIRRGRG